MPSQKFSIILPQEHPLGTEVETLVSAAQHVSLTFPVDQLQEKTVQVYATNPAGLAAPLQVWVEIAPLDVNAAYILLGVPSVLLVTGNAILAWTVHSSFARVVAQCPAWAAGAWAVQVGFEGKA